MDQTQQDLTQHPYCDMQEHFTPPLFMNELIVIEWFKVMSTVTRKNCNLLHLRLWSES